MFEIIHHDVPITENMQKCIDYIKNNEPEIAEYVNSLFLARKDEIQKQLLEYIAGQLNPIPPHFEWRYVGCPYDYSGALVEQGKISLNQSVEDFLENECHASDFFLAASAIEFAGISSMTLKEVLDTQKI